MNAPTLPRLTDPEASERDQVVTCPAGDYYVGDPCYAASHDTQTWSEYGEDSRWFQDSILAYNADRTKWCVGVGTTYGDGVYTSEDVDFAFGVDAGLLGVVPVASAEDNALGSMLRVTFAKPFEVFYDSETQEVVIGHIRIHTGDDGDEDQPCGWCGEDPEECDC